MKKQDTTNTETLEDKVPTKEDMIAFMREQIEFKKIQLEVQELDTKIAMARAEYMKAMYTIAQISAPQDNLKQHTITQEDLDANPELSEQGFKVGDVVGVGEDAPVETPAPSKSRGLKK